MLFLWVVLVFTAALYIFLNSGKAKKLPPGPPSVPLFGNLYFYLSQLHKTHSWKLAMWEINKQYGCVASFKQGWLQQYVVAGQSAVKEVLTHRATQGKTTLPIFKYGYLGEGGILFTTGETWTFHRRLTTKIMKSMGFGQKSMENVITEQALYLVNTFKEKARDLGSKGVEMHNAFQGSVLNTMWNIIAGCTLKYDDPLLLELVRLLHEYEKAVSRSGLCLNALPALRFVLPEFSCYNALMRLSKFGHEYVGRLLKEHRKTFKLGIVRDLIDGFLEEIEENPSDKLTDIQIHDIIGDLLLSGIDTGANTMSFIILYMILHPEVQHKVQEELDRVVGRERLPSINDMNRLPYTMATLQEVLRVFPVIPLAPRTTTEDIEIDGYTIPKNSIIWVNIYSVHMDEDYWKDPKNFRPERFLEKEHANGDPWLIPFGAGRRRCFGENLARMFLFLFLTTLLQKLTFRVVSKENPPSAKILDGVASKTRPYRAIVEARE